MVRTIPLLLAAALSASAADVRCCHISTADGPAANLWEQYAVEPAMCCIEAGGVSYDVDRADGHDIVFGVDARRNEISRCLRASPPNGAGPSTSWACLSGG